MLEEDANFSLKQLIHLVKASSKLKLSEFNLLVDIFACKLMRKELKHRYITQNCSVYKIAEYLDRSPTTIYRYTNEIAKAGFALKRFGSAKSLIYYKPSRVNKFFFGILDYFPKTGLNISTILKDDIEKVLQSKDFTSFESLIYMTIVYINHDTNRFLNINKKRFGFYIKTIEILELLEVEPTKSNIRKTQKAIKKFADKGLIKLKLGSSDICPKRSQDYKTIELTNDKYKQIFTSSQN